MSAPALERLLDKVDAEAKADLAIRLVMELMGEMARRRVIDEGSVTTIFSAPLSESAEDASMDLHRLVMALEEAVHRCVQPPGELDDSEEP